jgi:hypothetical protein
MRKSTRALVGLVVLDALIVMGIGWLVMLVRSGAATTVPPQEAIATITALGGGALGIVSVLLALVFVHHRRKGD